MLSAGFCHLLPDSLRHIAFTGRFPTATFLSALGYIITLLADQVVQLVTESNSLSSSSDDAQHRYRRLSHKGTPLDSLLGERSLTPEVAIAGECELYEYTTGHLQHRQGHQGHSHVLDPSGDMLLLDGVPDSRLNGLPSGALVIGSPRTAPSTAAAAAAAAATAAGAQNTDCHSAHLAVFLAQKPLSFATTVLLAGALCVHSILEGMALGAQQSMKDTEDIMIAIAAHKGLAAYALGASIVESKASTSKFWTTVITFATATPVGIFLGYGFSSMSSGAGGAAMSALASGTFLYVAMMEVIPKELASPNLRLPKMCMLLLGFGLMSLLAVWA
jgi:zinc transporter 1/2/3